MAILLWTRRFVRTSLAGRRQRRVTICSSESINTEEQMLIFFRPRLDLFFLHPPFFQQTAQGEICGVDDYDCFRLYFCVRRWIFVFRMYYEFSFYMGFVDFVRVGRWRTQARRLCDTITPPWKKKKSPTKYLHRTKHKRVVILWCHMRSLSRAVFS